MRNDGVVEDNGMRYERLQHIVRLAVRLQGKLGGLPQAAEPLIDEMVGRNTDPVRLPDFQRSNQERVIADTGDLELVDNPQHAVDTNTQRRRNRAQISVTSQENAVFVALQCLPSEGRSGTRRR